MKKIIAVVVVLILMYINALAIICQWDLVTLNLRKSLTLIIIRDCFTIEKWYDNETGIEVKTKEAGSLCLSEGTYFLISDDCPFCDHPTEKGGEG